MRAFGIILIGVGVALFLFVLISSFQNENTMISPIPENQGVRVIYVTPVSK